VELHVVYGDIFDLPVESIVNPENTRFDMARPVTGSISGQLLERYAPAIQYELYRQTQNKALPVGTVLETSGFEDYGRIYHIGHHRTDTWDAAELSEGKRAEHYSIVRTGMRETLQRFGDSEQPSIAFPLLGCGTFGLDPWLVTYEFMRVLMHQAGGESLSGKHVWLAVYHAEEYPATINAVTQAMADAADDWRKLPYVNLGIPYLDQLEEEKFTSGHPKWATWVLLLYTEQLTRYLLFQLAQAAEPPVLPPTLLEEKHPLSFGFARASACKLATTVKKDTSCKLRPLAMALVRDNKDLRRLIRLNQDRNNLAHGRPFRGLPEITGDLLDFVEDSQLRDLSEGGALMPTNRLPPWLHMLTSTKVAVLEEWSVNGYHYVEPLYGERFVVSREDS
jgi:O-acetyl-ADP-ribose deacetylase (regulator of RNase III)